MPDVDVVLANNDRVTLRVADTYLKVDGDEGRSTREIEAMRLAPVPTPEILWHKPPVLALAALRGAAFGTAEDGAPVGAWVAAGSVLRQLHAAPLPPWPGKSPTEIEARLVRESEWLIDHDVLPLEVVQRNRERAHAVLRPYSPCFVHGDLHDQHIFFDGPDVSGVIDWSEASQGDPLFDIASLTLQHPASLDGLLRGMAKTSTWT